MRTEREKSTEPNPWMTESKRQGILNRASGPHTPQGCGCSQWKKRLSSFGCVVADT